MFTPPFRPEASNVVTGSGVVYKNRVDAPIAQFTSDPTPHPSLLLTTQKSKREILSSLVLYRESSLSKSLRRRAVVALCYICKGNETATQYCIKCSKPSCCSLHMVARSVRTFAKNCLRISHLGRTAYEKQRFLGCSSQMFQMQ